MLRDHEPTQSQREWVKKLAAIGIPVHSIASLIGVSSSTLKLHYTHELEIGQDDMLEQVGSKAIELALDGNDRMVSLILKSKGAKSGWQERHLIEAVNSQETLELQEKLKALESVHIKDY